MRTEARRATASPVPGPVAAGEGSKQAAGAGTAAAGATLSAEEAAQQRRDSEAADLDAEIERRRLRVEEWRAKRAAAEVGLAWHRC